MLKRRAPFAFISLLILSFSLIACGGPTEEELQATKAAEDWAKLQQGQADLDAKHAELADLQNQMQMAGEDAEGEGMEGEDAEGEGMEGESAEGEAPPSPEELAAKADALQEEILGLAEQFGNKVIQFINEQDISEGAELTDSQLGAFRMKSDVDMLFAKDYIVRGGDYGKAIEIYDQALRNDPDNDKLLAAKASAESLQYMTQERLDQVKKGMTDQEVRALLGTPKAQYVREFPGDKIGWFYPKEVPRTAAGVYFETKKGALGVYDTDFDAIKADDEQ